MREAERSTGIIWGGAYERLTVKDSPGDWPVLNRRRVFLIQKQLAGDISAGELAESGGFQVEAAAT